MFTYEITELNEVYIYVDGQDLPVIYQPDWPIGEPWANAQEAAAWAEAKIEEMTNADSEFVAGSGPDSPLEPRPPVPPNLESLSQVVDQILIEMLES